jgi:hypothetical protein
VIQAQANLTFSGRFFAVPQQMKPGRKPFRFKLLLAGQGTVFMGVP